MASKKKKKNSFEPTITPISADPGYVNRASYCPFPVAPVSPFAVPIPNGTRVVNSGYGINSAVELPAYMCTDQYGRVYQAQVFYGTLPCSAPVPIPAPNMAPPQVQPIIIPVQDNKRF